MYHKIGWWKGPNATGEARTLLCDFWREQGDQGLRWLVSRLRPEWHIDLLDGVASILARWARLQSPPRLTNWSAAVSRTGRGPPQGAGWIGEQGKATSAPLGARLGLVLATFLGADDPGLREWAAPRGSAASSEAGNGSARGPAQCGDGC